MDDFGYIVKQILQEGCRIGDGRRGRPREKPVRGGGSPKMGPYFLGIGSICIVSQRAVFILQR